MQVQLLVVVDEEVGLQDIGLKSECVRVRVTQQECSGAAVWLDDRHRQVWGLERGGGGFLSKECVCV